MGAPLTLKQTISIATQSSVPPYHASSLVKNYGTLREDAGLVVVGYPLSLLSARDRVQAQQSIFIVQIRNPSILSSSANFAAVQANWSSLNPAWVPTKASLLSLFQVLSGSGVVAKKLSKDWRTMGMVGTAGAFASIPVRILDAASGLALIDGAAGLASGILIGLGALAGAPVTLIYVGVGLGAAAVGNLGALGVMEIASSQPGNPSPAPAATQSGDSQVYGAPSPADAGAIDSTLADAPAVDATTIPDAPAVPPICPTMICPTVPICPPGPPPVCPIGPPVCPGAPPICPGSL
jgi:hypothetical protein